MQDTEHPFFGDVVNGLLNANPALRQSAFIALVKERLFAEGSDLPVLGYAQYDFDLLHSVTEIACKQLERVQDYVRQLDELNEDFRDKMLGSFEHGRKREELLGKCVAKLANFYGVELRKPLQIDSRGEFALVVDNQSDPLANFKAMAHILNRHEPRCGATPGSILMPGQSTWCQLHHFGAETMVREVLVSQPEQKKKIIMSL